MEIIVEVEGLGLFFFFKIFGLKEKIGGFLI